MKAPWIALAMWSAASAAGASTCREYLHFTLRLEGESHAVIALRDQDVPLKLCGELPRSGNENLRIVLRDAKDRELYAREIFVDRTRRFHGADKDRLTGGAGREGASAVFSALLPRDAFGSRKATQVFIYDLKGGTELGKGIIRDHEK